MRLLPDEVDGLLYCFIRVDEEHGGILLEPRELLLGIDPGVSLDFLNGEIKRPFSIQIMEQLLVAYSVEGIAMAVRYHLLDFIKESVIHHSRNTTVDAIKELLPWSVQTEFDYVEGAPDFSPTAETAEGLSGHVAYLESMYHPLVVTLIAAIVVCRIQELELREQGVEAFLLIARAKQTACVFVDSGNVVNAMANGVDVHH